MTSVRRVGGFVLSATVSLLLLVPASAAALGLQRSEVPIGAKVTALMVRVTHRYVAAENVVSDVQELPSSAMIRRGAASTTVPQLRRGERLDATDQRSDSRLRATLAGEIAKFRGLARRTETATVRTRDRAIAQVLLANEALLSQLTSRLRASNRVLAGDISATRRHSRDVNASTAITPGLAHPEIPPSATVPTVVSLGDSYISGEGGRWAGNTELLGSSTLTDVGSDAYFLPGSSSEEIAGCHRSRSAEIGFTPDALPENLTFRNLACSGATTATDTSGLLFKPGIDFYPYANVVNSTNLTTTSPREGQALQLERVAKQVAVRMVVLSIGGNDFHFSNVITTCAEDYLKDVALTHYGYDPIYCKNDPSVTAQVTAAARYQRKIAIYRAMQNVYEAMSAAGYRPSEWKFVIQLYPAPLPASNDFRYPEFDKKNPVQRQFDGGCGVMNRDVDWARDTFLPTVNQEVMAAGRMLETQLVGGNDNILYLHTNPTFVNHTLCSKTTSLVTAGWRTSGAAKRAEWITQIRVLSSLFSRLPPYQLQESLHPDYWGQLAMRNCLRQLWNDGAGPPVGRFGGPGTQWHCNDETSTTSSGLNDYGEPLVKLFAGATGSQPTP